MQLVLLLLVLLLPLRRPWLRLLFVVILKMLYG
jgi:hypothetical protein